MCGMRRQSRSPNMQVYWRANQFPCSRFGSGIFMGRRREEEEEVDDGTELPDNERDKLQYLKDRYKPTHTSGVDGIEGPCGK